MDGPFYPVEKIVDKRLKHGKIEYLIRWKNYTPDTDSWEPSNSIKDTCYPIIKEFNRKLRLLKKTIRISTSGVKLLDLSRKKIKQNNKISPISQKSKNLKLNNYLKKYEKGKVENVSPKPSTINQTVKYNKPSKSVTKLSKNMVLYLENNETEETYINKQQNAKVNGSLSVPLSRTSNNIYSDENTKTSSPRSSFNSMDTEKMSNQIEEQPNSKELKRKYITNQHNNVKKIKIFESDSSNHLSATSRQSFHDIECSFDKFQYNDGSIKQTNISVYTKSNRDQSSCVVSLEPVVTSNEFDVIETKLDKCLKRLPYQKHKDSENMETVDALSMRRKSARQMGASNRFREIILRRNRTAGYTEISLYNNSHSLPNCFTVKTLNELSAALKQAINDSSRVLLFTAVGKVFSSGLDLESIVQNIPNSFSNVKNSKFSTAQLANPLSHNQHLHDLAESLKRFLLQLLNFPKPIIVGVNGPAIGLGCAILPLCDLIYATESSSFYLPYTRLSQFPEGGTSVTLSMLIGMPAATQLLLGGRRWSSKDALSKGLISEIIFSDKFKMELVSRCKKLAKVPSMSLESMKCMLRFQFKEKIELSINVECKKLLGIWRTIEFRNSAQYFIEKELPDLLL